MAIHFVCNVLDWPSFWGWHLCPGIRAHATWRRLCFWKRSRPVPCPIIMIMRKNQAMARPCSLRTAPQPPNATSERNL